MLQTSSTALSRSSAIAAKKKNKFKGKLTRHTDIFLNIKDEEQMSFPS
jgi:hypothetical protein